MDDNKILRLRKINYVSQNFLLLLFLLGINLLETIIGISNRFLFVALMIIYIFLRYTQEIKKRYTDNLIVDNMPTVSSDYQPQDIIDSRHSTSIQSSPEALMVALGYSFSSSDLQRFLVSAK